MTYLELQERVAEMLGLPSDDASFTDKIKKWINESYHWIATNTRWPWLLKNDVIQTVTEITTGTVSINSGATALTFSSGPSVSVADDYRIQLQGSDDWYDISAHTAGSTSATLADAYLGDSNLSGATYKLRKVYYSLPSDFDKMYSVRQAITDVTLRPLDTRTFDGWMPDPTRVADPENYMLMGLDSSNNWRMSFYPTPDQKMNIDIRFYKRITELSADADEPIIPKPFHSILVYDVLAKYGYLFIDDTRIQAAKIHRDTMLREMIEAKSPVPDKQVTKEPWDVTRHHGHFHYPYWHRLRFDFPVEE